LVEEIRKTLPELPSQRAERFTRDFGLSRYDACVLVQDKALANYYESCVEEKANAKLTSNWIQSELLALLRTRKLDIGDCPVKPKDLAGLIRLIEAGTISGKIAKEILPEMFESGKPATPDKPDTCCGLLQCRMQSSMRRKA